jgi:hypothetical protein
VPGARRKATDPASAPPDLVSGAEPGGPDTRGADREHDGAEAPVGALVARGMEPA